MKNNRTLGLAILSLLLFIGNAPLAAKVKNYTLSSPDGGLKVEISTGDGLSYRIMHENDTILSHSNIGLVLADGTLVGKSSRVTRERRKKIEDKVESPFYRFKEFIAACNELDLKLQGGFGVTFRAYDDGVAYRFYTTVASEVTVKDEMAEFKRQTLDVLRQPMEEGKIFLARSRGNFVYPADFMLLGATNPCPCGYYPDRNRCRCQDWEVRRYLARLSGPLLDRMDLCCQIKQTPIRKLWEKREASYIDSDKNGSKWMREQVLEARKRQQMRCRGAAMRENGRLSPGEILKYCPLGLEEQEFLEQASEQAGLSMRGCHRVIRVARTIADLEGKDRIGVEHLGQALFFRNQNVLRE